MNPLGILEIKHLRTICTLADTGNMTRAAERLSISQSALSQQLKDLESRLEVDLFHRSNRRMQLTPIGRQLLATARQIVARIEEAELAISRYVVGDQGELKVGTQCLFCYKWLPRVMEAFRCSFPKVELSLGVSMDPNRELQTGAFDLIITGAGVTLDDRCSRADLFSDHLVCIMGNDHRFAGHHHLELADFAEVELISHADRDGNRFYQQILRPRGIEPRRFMSIGQPAAILEMVAAGFGVSIFPRWAVQQAEATLPITCRPIGRTGFPLTWQAVYLSKMRVPVFLSEFIRIIGRAGPRTREEITPRLVSPQPA